MENKPHGIIIKVENLELCRVFYRDILDLGKPLIDSNIWVEFRLGREVSLILEKIEANERLSVRKGRLSWMFHVDNLDEMVARLKEHGVEPFSDEGERIGFKVLKYNDPEGNSFYVYSTKENVGKNIKGK